MTTNDIIASVALKVDSTQAVDQLDRFDGRIDAVKMAVGSLTGALASLFAGSQFARGVQKLLSDASDAQEVFGKYEAVFEGLTTQADAAAAELNQAFNFDLTSAQDSLSTMADIFHKSGLSMKESLEYAAELNKRAADVEAFTNASGGLAQVTEAFTGAMLGFGMSAQRLGVVVKDETVEEQRALEARQGLRFETERAAKMHARYSVILQQSASAAGQVARESDNYSNRLRRLKADFADLTSSVGEVFIEPATKATKALNKVVDAINGMDKQTRNAVVVATTAGVALATLAPAVLTVVGAIKTYRNIAAIAGAQTAENTAAEIADANASNVATAAKERQAVATNASAAALARETAALTANASAVEKSAAASALSSGGYRSRLSNRGAEIASGVKRYGFNEGYNYRFLNGGANAAALARETAAGKNVVTAIKNPFASIGKYLEGLIPIGGKLGLVLKGLARFLGPIAAVWAALEGLKQAPELFEKALDFLPVVKDGASKLVKKAGALIVEYTPVVVNYVKDLFVGAFKGAVALQRRLQGLFVNNVIVPLLEKVPIIGGKIANAAKKAFPAETEFSRQYAAEKELAKRRQETAKATEQATKAETSIKRASAQYDENAQKIQDSYLSDDERKTQDAIKSAQTRLDDATTKLRGLESQILGGATVDASEIAQARGESQQAQIELATTTNDAEQKQTLADLQKRFSTALESSTNDEQRQEAVDALRFEIDALRSKSQQAARQAQEYNARAARFQTQADNLGENARGDRFRNMANEESVKARIATSQTFSGEKLDALNELERSAKDALDGIQTNVKERAAFAFRKSLDALGDAQDESLSKQAELIKERAETLEKELASAKSEQERLQIEQEVYSLRQEARQKEQDALEKDKEAQKKRFDYFANFALENARSSQDKLDIYKQTFERADKEFESAKNDDERYNALDGMRQAAASLDEYLKQNEERARKSASTPIDAQQALTSGSLAAFQIENRIRNVWQDKMLSSSSTSNVALNRIYARLGELQTEQKRDGAVEIEIV